MIDRKDFSLLTANKRGQLFVPIIEQLIPHTSTATTSQYFALQRCCPSSVHAVYRLSLSKWYVYFAPRFRKINLYLVNEIGEDEKAVHNRVIIDKFVAIDPNFDDSDANKIIDWVHQLVRCHHSCKASIEA